MFDPFSTVGFDRDTTLFVSNQPIYFDTNLYRNVYYPYDSNGPRKLFRGAWLTEWEFDDLMRVARQPQRPKRILPTFVLPRITMRVIKQPCWSSRRWKSLT